MELKNYKEIKSKTEFLEYQINNLEVIKAAQEKSIEKLKSEREELKSDTEKIEQYIESIQDYVTKLIFEYRFIYGFEWAKTVKKIGAGYTEDLCKKRVYRYLKQNPL